MNNIQDYIDKATTLPDGQSLVGVFEMGKGSFHILIGDKLSQQINEWAVTEAELVCLRDLLNKKEFKEVKNV